MHSYDIEKSVERHTYNLVHATFHASFYQKVYMFVRSMRVSEHIIRMCVQEKSCICVCTHNIQIHLSRCAFDWVCRGLVCTFENMRIPTHTHQSTWLHVSTNLYFCGIRVDGYGYIYMCKNMSAVIQNLKPHSWCLILRWLTVCPGVCTDGRWKRHLLGCSHMCANDLIMWSCIILDSLASLCNTHVD